MSLEDFYDIWLKTVSFCNVLK